ncbi:hypothetical protein PMAYCL1PPCAC_03773, partial [Pristionchus mayeri]
CFTSILRSCMDRKMEDNSSPLRDMNLRITAQSPFPDIDLEAEAELITSAANHSFMCGRPIKTIAYAHILILFILCPALSNMFNKVSSCSPFEFPVSEELLLNASVACLIPIPFLIIGFIAIRAEHAGLVFFFSICSLGLTLLACIFWASAIFGLTVMFVGGHDVVRFLQESAPK